MPVIGPFKSNVPCSKNAHFQEELDQRCKYGRTFNHVRFFGGCPDSPIVADCQMHLGVMDEFRYTQPKLKILLHMLLF